LLNKALNLAVQLSILGARFRGKAKNLILELLRVL
jgi:hypothetical protein